MKRRRHAKQEQDERPPEKECVEPGEEGRVAADDTEETPQDDAPNEESPADPVADLTDKWLRAKAELENVRRTARMEADLARRYGAGPVILGLLSALDNLQRALAAPPESLEPDYLAGLQLIERQFLDVLATNGVTPVPADRGTPLDPAMHRALMEQDSDDIAPGCILLVAVPGYRLHDRLLREAQVIVARTPAPAEA